MNKTISMLVLAMVLVSCQKVIDLELDTASAELVIQGNIYNSPGPYTVTLSTTVDFDEKNEFPPISDALVIITDNQGIIDTLKEKSPGKYVTSKIVGIPGYTYSLFVKIQDNTFSSSSTMPEPVEINTIYTENSGMDNKILCVDFLDPENEENYFKLVEYKNGKQITEFYVTSDDLHPGEMITYRIMPMGMDSDGKLESGDLVAIRLETIDKNVYEYFRTAGQDGSQSASPSNPVSNISGNVLGYFNACSATKKSITVKE